MVWLLCRVVSLCLSVFPLLAPLLFFHCSRAHSLFQPFLYHSSFFFLLPLIYLSVSSSLSPLDSIAVYNEWQGKRETLVRAFTTTGSVWPHTAPAIAVVTRSNTALIEWHAEGLGGGGGTCKAMCSACGIGVNGLTKNKLEHTVTMVMFQLDFINYLINIR